MSDAETPQPLFIAEVSSNHGADLQRCLQFIDRAAAIGCDGIKFQLFRIRELFAPEILSRSKAHRERKEWELSESFLPRLAERARERKLLFACTPFYLEAVARLEPHVDFIKIASYEILWKPLLVRCAESGLPVVLSTGMATLAEVDEAVETLRLHSCKDLTLLHCVSGYPTPRQECNLAAIATLRQRFRCPAGWSDHTRCPEVIHRAVHRWEAAMVEFHLDLDGSGQEFKMGHCWLPDEIEKVINSITLAWSADGDGVKTPLPSEKGDRFWRADPIDGLRPLRATRQAWSEKWESDTQAPEEA